VMSFAELEQAAPQTRSRFTAIESSVFVRVAALTLILINHVWANDFTGPWLPNLSGGAFALLIVAGYNFSRFPLKRLEQGRFIETLGAIFIKIVLPYYLVISIFFLAERQIFLPQYLLYSTITSGFVYNGTRKFQNYWFIETYVWIMGLLCVLFVPKFIRRISMARPQVLAVAALAISFFAEVFIRWRPNSSALLLNNPLSLTYLFAFGWVAAQTRTNFEKLIVLAAALIAFYILLPTFVFFGVPIMIGALALLMLVKKVPVGCSLAKMLSVIASASLYIYIFHSLVIHAAEVAFGQTIPFWAKPFVLVICPLPGLAVWRIIEFGESRRGRVLLARIRETVFGQRQPA